MNKMFIVVKREYFTRVRSKAFVIGTLLSPLFLIALVVLPSFLADKSKGNRHITVLDQSGDPKLFSEISQRLESPNRSSLFSSPPTNENSSDVAGNEKKGFGNLQFQLTQIVVPADRELTDFTTDYNKQVEKNSDEAYMVLPRGVLTDQRPSYYAKNPSDIAVEIVENTINDVIKERRLGQAGIDSGKLNEYMKPVRLERRNPQGKEEKGVPRFAIGMVMLFFIYMTTLFYGIFVMRGVMEEKQSRIVEVIVSSVKPFELMMGKLIGIGLVGLTQYTIWILCFLLMVMFGASFFEGQGIPLPHIPGSLMIYFVLFFILGYFLFASLYAMVGAIVSSEEDAQQVQLPVTLLVIIPMMLFGLVLTNPNSPTSIFLSMVPFFAPTLMMMRIAMIEPPVWQVILSMAGMVVTILGLVWLVGRIYRIGILMYGKRPSIAEIGRWVRYR